MKPIISVEGLGKSYTIRHEGQTPYKSLREEIFKLPKRLLSRGGQSQEEFWALKDVNFDIMPGDRVGIIGRNGAGKSTLLKLLSRITEPTTGRITMRGRVASLLEVGTGFHPELTGRENIYLNGAILGMTRAEVRRKFDEIVDFAGVEKFLDTPVKRYSSGMYVRLAFAVAANLEPEILIVDEVLAVGDAEFQKKCLGKMEEVSKGQGRTVLFVSHNMEAVRTLCSKGSIFASGRLIAQSDDIGYIVDAYLQKEQQISWCWHNDGSSVKRDVILEKMELVNGKGCYIKEPVTAGSDVYVKLSFQVLKNIRALTLGVALYDSRQNNLFWSYHTDAGSDFEPIVKNGYLRIITRIPVDLLNDGTYTLECIGGIHNIKWLYAPLSSPSLSFEVLGGHSISPFWQSRRPGLLAPVLKWENF